MKYLLSCSIIFVAVAGLAGVGPGAVAAAPSLSAWLTKLSPPERFAVLPAFEGQAVLDRETQLVWQRSPGDEPDVSSHRTTFQLAVRHCYRQTTGGRMGWRLPTAEELSSLLVRSAVPGRGVLPAGHPFRNIEPSWYWSISEGSFAGIPGRHAVALTQPHVTTVALETDLERVLPTLCVRGHGGGQSTSTPY